MVRVLALTQFAFLTLGIVTLKIMVQANPNLSTSSYLQQLNGIALWVFVVPLVWIAFASICAHVNKGPLSPKGAQVVGVLVAVLSFLFLATVTFLPSLAPGR
jgi:hypothetical protein